MFTGSKPRLTVPKRWQRTQRASKVMRTNVLVIAHNRPKLLIEVLKNLNHIESLYLFCDGPANGPSHAENQYLQNEIKEIFENIKKQRKNLETKIYCVNQNLGPRDGPIEAINWLFENKEYGCILEEDTVASNEFVEYYSTCLEIFKEDKEIALISSCPIGAENFIKNCGTKSQIFLTWGWATWQDRWKSWDMKNKGQLIKQINSEEKRRKVYSKFMSLTAQLYFKRELHQLQQNPEYVWSYYIQSKIKTANQQTIVPRCNMSKNIGFDKNALRTKTPRDNKCDPTQTAKTLKMLKENGKFEDFESYKDKKLEKLKYGSLIKEIRAWLKMRTRLKHLLTNLQQP
jgi:hypothetical protein